MQYEVELKFPVDDPAPVLAQLDQLGSQAGSVHEQQDRYFAHPVRDFAETDEAFRIRSDGPSNCVTYKGPVVDPQVKSRHEIEVSFADGEQSVRQLTEILTRLGFREVRTVRKRRTPHRFTWENWAVELTLDEVDELGTFIEIETLADESVRNAARDAILRLAKRLGLKNPQRKSYLCLLLDRDGG